jgi:hypothetical protein
MSNPLKPTKLGISEIADRTTTHALQMFHLSDAVEVPQFKEYKQPEKVWELVHRHGLDLQFVESVLMDNRCVDKSVREQLSRGKAVLASAPVGGLQGRTRDLAAVQAAQVYYDALGSTDEKRSIREACESKLLVAGGAHFAFGRILQYYPKRGAGRDLVPPTAREVEIALAQCGLSGPLPTTRLSLSAAFADAMEEGEVEVVADAENGFPTMGKFRDAEAREACLRYAAALRNELESHRSNMDGHLTALEARDPLLFTVRGKAKSDMYKWSKVEGGALRFYNVIGRPLTLIMQQATQVLERSTGTLATTPVVGDRYLATVMGHALTGGGADALVTHMDWQLASTGYARLHCGDDTWLAVRTDEGVALFSIDCSAFDLTQHSSVSEPVHAALRRRLEEIDPVSAAVWHKMARQRRTVVAGSITAVMKHGGPSGMPLQSKVNDMLMDVYLQRVIMTLHKHRQEGLPMTQDVIESAIQKEGASLGFVVRLEELDNHVGVTTVRECLERHPFLFVGYRFHVRNGMVMPYIDIPRAIARLPYNSSFDWLEKQAHSVRTAIRIGGLVLSMGVPPAGEERAFAKLVAAARFGLARQLHTAAAEKEVEFQVNRLVFVADSVKYTIRDMRGLLNALTPERISQIWAEGTEIVEDDALDDWADAVDAEEAQMRYASPLEWLQQRAELRSIAPGGRIPGQRPVGLRIMSAAVLGRVPPTIPREIKAPPVRSVGMGDVRAKAKKRLQFAKETGYWPAEDDDDWESEVSSRDYGDWE